MDEGGLMGYGNYSGMYMNPGDDPEQQYEMSDFSQMPNGMQGRVAGSLGQFSGVNRALGSPYGRIGANALMGMLGGQNPGQALMGAGLDYGKNAALKYAGKHLLGGALGGQAASFLGGPYGMLASAALPFLGKGISSLGKSLGIGKRSGPSAQDLAMGEAKGNMINMRGSYGADMATGKSMLDKYNPMLEAQIGRMQDLANRGLSSEYNTRQMAGAATNTESARRAAEARMRATGGMLGGGQALAGYGGINQAAVGGMAQGSYNAAQNNMNSQPGYINQLSGMIGGQINRGQGMFNQGRQGMMGLDQGLYNLNAQEKARADALSQANRARESQMIGGIANLAGTAAGMEQSRKQNRDYMNMLYGNGRSATTPDVGGSGMQNIPVDSGGNYDIQTMRELGMLSTADDMPPPTYSPVDVAPRYPLGSPIQRPQGIPMGFPEGEGNYVDDPITGERRWVPNAMGDPTLDPYNSGNNWTNYRGR